MIKEEYRFQFNKNIIVTLSDERLITPSGLCMVGQIFGKSSLAKKAARMTTDKRSQPQIKFFVKHNFRRENKEEMAESLKKVCQNIKEPREGKTIYIGTTWKNIITENKGEICVRGVYEIIERTLDPSGQFLLDPEQEIFEFIMLWLQYNF